MEIYQKLLSQKKTLDDHYKENRRFFKYSPIYFIFFGLIFYTFKNTDLNFYLTIFLICFIFWKSYQSITLVESKVIHSNLSNTLDILKRDISSCYKNSSQSVILIDDEFFDLIKLETELFIKEEFIKYDEETSRTNDCLNYLSSIYRSVLEMNIITSIKKDIPLEELIKKNNINNDLIGFFGFNDVKISDYKDFVLKYKYFEN